MRILHEIEEDEQAVEDLLQTTLLNEKKTEHNDGQDNFLHVMRAATEKIKTISS